jgi:hypothetical protein
MSSAVQRPGFYEGQIVAAADLNSVVSSSRTALAQHERYLHSWGIAHGLTLTGVARTTSGGASFQEVTLSAGMAVDGTGRHLVLAADERLSEDTFDSLNVAISDPEAYYPVFITGRDESKTTNGTFTSACNAGGVNRVTERVDIVFGRVEDAADLMTQTVPAVDAGPGDGASSTRWRVLVGFVKWDASIKRFVAIATNSDGVTPLYAGVRADDVTTHSTHVVLRAGPRGQNGTAALAVENANGGELRFGLQTTNGDVIPVFTVNGKGDVHAEGKITGAIAGGVQVQGGVAFDGAMLPLPPGITAEQVDSGAVLIQTQVSPHYAIPALPPPGAGVWMMQPIECRVDGRRVFCRVRWRDSAGVAADLELPGACDYLLLAFAASE